VDVPPGLGCGSQRPQRYGPGGLNSENNVPYFRNFRAAQTIHQEVLIHRKFAPISARRARQHQNLCSMLLLCSMREIPLTMYGVMTYLRHEAHNHLADRLTGRRTRKAKQEDRNETGGTDPSIH
jgi:hypothetical protein